jgi:hypothetical protein
MWKMIVLIVLVLMIAIAVALTYGSRRWRYATSVAFSRVVNAFGHDALPR